MPLARTEGKYLALNAAVHRLEKLAVAQLGIKIPTRGDPSFYEQVPSLIADRYGNGLYEQIIF